MICFASSVSAHPAWFCSCPGALSHPAVGGQNLAATLVDQELEGVGEIRRVVHRPVEALLGDPSARIPLRHELVEPGYVVPGFRGILSRVESSRREQTVVHDEVLAIE